MSLRFLSFQQLSDFWYHIKNSFVWNTTNLVLLGLSRSQSPPLFFSIFNPQLWGHSDSNSITPYKERTLQPYSHKVVQCTLKYVLIHIHPLRVSLSDSTMHASLTSTSCTLLNHTERELVNACLLIRFLSHVSTVCASVTCRRSFTIYCGIY